VIFEPTLHRAIRRLRRIAYSCVLGLRLFRLIVQNRWGRDLITRSGGPAVCLTTYGKRIETVHLAIESIARGRDRPSRLILWIDDAKLMQNITPGLRRLQQRGLEIKSCQDFGPHKKYYPYIASLQEILVPLVTADDDLIYSRCWLKNLNEEYRRFPNVINCYRARTITFEDAEISKYMQWEFVTSTQASFRHFAGSGAGAIIPIELQALLKQRGSEFVQCCPRADDIWLHVQGLRAGYRVRQIDSKRLRLFTIPRTQRVALQDSNLTGGGNDRQIKQTYTAADILVLRNEAST
jgi:hypothetical protein